MKRIIGQLVSVLLFVQLFACSGGGGGGSDAPNSAQANVAPTANAGADQVVDEQTSVTLTGAGTDSDGSIASYSWSQTAGSSVTLTNAGTASASFTAPTLIVAEKLTLLLTVTDNDGATATDSVDITVNPVNTAPTANAGSDQTLEGLTLVTLAGSGSDNDGSIASYLWSQTAGTPITLSDTNTASATFSAPDVTVNEVFTFELTVTDNEGVTATDSVDISVNPFNIAPIANAGSGQFVVGGDMVTLDASGSSDAESASLSYSWLQTDSTGISIALDDNSLVQPTFNAPMVTAVQVLTFEVTVTDEGGKFHSASVNIADSPLITQKINDTGMTACGDYAYGGSIIHNNNLNCSLTTDADGDPIPAEQDGHSGRDVTVNDDSDGHAGFSFTKLDASGYALATSATEWSCVKDNVTALIWEVKTIDGGLRDATNIYTWYNANASTNGGSAGTENGGTCPDTGNCDTDKFVASVNALGLCGPNDWRLPNKEELRSIVDYSIGYPGPTIDVNYFPNNLSSWYWSSSPYASNSSGAWVVHFNSGDDALTYDKNIGRQVRLVRGGQ